MHRSARDLGDRAVAVDDEEQFRKAYQEQADKIGRFNLALFGKTGVGKSTLINAVFGDDVAPTGIGVPVTQDKHLYLHRTGFFGLLDTRGLEIGEDTDQILKELVEYIDTMRQQPLSEQIHVAWYCVGGTNARLEAIEEEFIRRLEEHLPVIVVLTKVPSRTHPLVTGLSDHIAGLGLPIEHGRPVLTLDTYIASPDEVKRGLDDLLAATFREAPEGVRNALIAAQKVDLARKRQAARVAIGIAATAAGAVGATPIPFADGPIIAAAQISLLARISAIYGIDFKKTGLASVVPVVLTGAGRAVGGGAVKLFPGAGSVSGGAINGATGAFFTGAIGAAWMGVCDQLSQGKLMGVDGAIDEKAVKAFFETMIKAEIFTKKNPTAELPGA